MLLPIADLDCIALLTQWMYCQPESPCLSYALDTQDATHFTISTFVPTLHEHMYLVYEEEIEQGQAHKKNPHDQSKPAQAKGQHCHSAHKTLSLSPFYLINIAYMSK